MFFRDYTIKVTDLPVERGGKLVGSVTIAVEGGIRIPYDWAPIPPGFREVKGDKPSVRIFTREVGAAHMEDIVNGLYPWMGRLATDGKWPGIYDFQVGTTITVAKASIKFRGLKKKAKK